MSDDAVKAQIQQAKAEEAARGNENGNVSLSRFFDPRKDPALREAKKDAAVQMGAHSQHFMVLWMSVEDGRVAAAVDLTRPQTITPKPGAQPVRVYPVLRFTTRELAEAWVRLMGTPEHRYLVVEAVADHDPETHVGDKNAVPSMGELHGFMIAAGFRREDNRNVTRAEGEPEFVGYRNDFAAIPEESLDGRSWREISKVLGWM